MADSRDAAFAHRLRFFENRRFAIVPKQGEFAILNFFLGSAGASQDGSFGLSSHALLIGVFADLSQ
jgi:hypothetical protein